MPPGQERGQDPGYDLVLAHDPLGDLLAERADRRGQAVQLGDVVVVRYGQVPSLESGVGRSKGRVEIRGKPRPGEGSGLLAKFFTKS